MKINTKHKYSYLLDNLKKNGWCKYENAFSKEITEKLKYEIKKNDKKYLNIQKKKWIRIVCTKYLSPYSFIMSKFFNFTRKNTN